jgi:hypothetical protein
MLQLFMVSPHNAEIAYFLSDHFVIAGIVDCELLNLIGQIVQGRLRHFASFDHCLPDTKI